MINKFIKIIIISFLVIVSINGQETKEDFYSQISRAVIRLEHFVPSIDGGLDNLGVDTKPDGTAFFIARGTDLYVVTARHVIEKDYDMVSRVKCENLLTGDFDYLYLILPNDRWIFHPEEGDSTTHFVDVAVQKINGIRDRSIKQFRYESEDSELYEKNLLPNEDATPPETILSFGFPSYLGFTLKEQRPLGRTGIIAMITGKEFIKIDSEKYAEERIALLDINMFDGNSGSPVMNNFRLSKTNPKLLGLIIATNEKFNFAVMEPVSRIIETLELAKEQSTENLKFWYLRP